LPFLILKDLLLELQQRAHSLARLVGTAGSFNLRKAINPTESFYGQNPGRRFSE
jgi:hypothetical protein